MRVCLAFFLLATASAWNAFWKRPELSATAKRGMTSTTTNEKEPGMKFCANCMHCVLDKADPQYSTCRLFPRFNAEFLVTGNPKDIQKYKFCSTARQYDDMCGKDATKFEAKP